MAVVVLVEGVEDDVHAELVGLVGDFGGGAGVVVLPGVVDVARMVGFEEGPSKAGGREPFRVRHRGEAASTTLRILIASNES